MVHTVGNAVEAALWAILGLVMAGFALRPKTQAKRSCLQAAVVFVVFGLSDVVEMRTGAWWRPWWLLGWKALCVLALAALLVGHWRRRNH